MPISFPIYINETKLDSNIILTHSFITYTHTMTEIINLFRNNQHSPHLHQQLFSQPNKHTLSSYNNIESPSRLKDNWNLGEL